MATKRKSPYQRYNKTPWKYSELHKEWRECTLRGDQAGADEAARRHYNRFVRFGHEIFGMPQAQPAELAEAA